MNLKVKTIAGKKVKCWLLVDKSKWVRGVITRYDTCYEWFVWNNRGGVTSKLNRAIQKIRELA